MAFAVCITCLACPAVGSAQGNPNHGQYAARTNPPATPAPASTFPRDADGHPDFSGIWNAGSKDFADTDEAELNVPLTPKYAAIRKQWLAAAEAGRPMADSVARCLAFGTPRIMSFGTFEIIQKPKELWVLTEVLHEVRRIYLDGRQRPDADADHTYGGYSLGHWDGDTLTVETDHILGNALDQTGIFVSDSLRVVERIRMINRDALEDEVTLYDPIALTRPWTVVQRLKRSPPGTEIDEYICTQNNRNPAGADGQTLNR